MKTNAVEIRTHAVFPVSIANLSPRDQFPLFNRKGSVRYLEGGLEEPSVPLMYSFDI